MSSSRKNTFLAIPVLLAGLSITPTLASGAAAGGVYVNGAQLSPQQVEMLWQSTGVLLPPGHYVVQNGCVAHLESGQVQCARQAGQYSGGDAYGYGGGYAYGGDVYGYGNEAYSYGGGAGGGYGYNDGSGGWFHRGGDYSGGYSVGGDGSGCIYTADWSNC